MERLTIADFRTLCKIPAVKRAALAKLRSIDKSISEVPREIWSIILSFLERIEIMFIRRTSKLWNDLHIHLSESVPGNYIPVYYNISFDTVIATEDCKDLLTIAKWPKRFIQTLEVKNFNYLYPTLDVVKRVNIRIGRVVVKGEGEGFSFSRLPQTTVIVDITTNLSRNYPLRFNGKRIHASARNVPEGLIFWERYSLLNICIGYLPIPVWVGPSESRGPGDICKVDLSKLDLPPDCVARAMPDSNFDVFLYSS